MNFILLATNSIIIIIMAVVVVVSAAAAAFGRCQTVFKFGCVDDTNTDAGFVGHNEIISSSGDCNVCVSVVRKLTWFKPRAVSAK